MKKKAKILTTLLTVSALLSVTFLMRLFLHSRIVTQYPSVSATAFEVFENTYISSETGSDRSWTEGRTKGVSGNRRTICQGILFSIP